MDLAARLHGHTTHLTPALVQEYAAQARIGRRQLLAIILPVLKAADVVEFRLAAGELDYAEEYVGLTGRLIEQSVRVLEQLSPSETERALLHRVELASRTPLTQAQHLEQLGRRGFDDAKSAAGLQHALAAGVNPLRVASTELRENVVFNPYVWGSGQVPIAGFLRSLPPAEREALLSICEQASDRPGLALPALTSGSPATINSARKVGLLQASTVKSTGRSGASQTYVFSPLLESEERQAAHHGGAPSPQALRRAHPLRQGEGAGEPWPGPEPSGVGRCPAEARERRSGEQHRHRLQGVL